MPVQPSSLPPQHQARQPGLEAERHPRPEYIRPGGRGSGKLDGKVALITDGDSGIGRAAAVHFAREGADVAIVYKPEAQPAANETERLVQAEGRRCLQLAGDLRDERFCEAIVHQTIRALSRLNIVVSNAGGQFVGPDVAELAHEPVADAFRVHSFPLVWVVKAALPHLHEGDAIIATSPGSAHRGGRQLADYTSTKGAITAYIRSLAPQLAEQEIRASTVAPGPSWLPLGPASFPAGKLAAFGTAPTRKRPGQFPGVAGACVFLAAEDTAYFPGQAMQSTGAEVLHP